MLFDLKNPGRTIWITHAESGRILARTPRNQMDFLLIDGEHGRFSFQEMCGLVSEIDEKTNCFVRVPAEPLPSDVCRIFDSGATGLLISGVNDEDQVHKCRQYASYAPLGSRSYSPFCPGNSYIKSEGNFPNLIGSIIESIEGFDSCAEIIDASDFIYYGAYDMMIALNDKELYSAESFRMLYEIGHRCAFMNKPLIAMATSFEQKVLLGECGVTVFCIGVDSDMFLSMQEARIKEMQL